MNVACWRRRVENSVDIHEITDGIGALDELSPLLGILGKAEAGQTETTEADGAGATRTIVSNHQCSRGRSLCARLELQHDNTSRMGRDCARAIIQNRQYQISRATKHDILNIQRYGLIVL